MLYEDITKVILAGFYAVYNTLGHGFLEQVYENALAHELCKRGLAIEQQKQITVYYDGVVVGTYYADIVVDDKIILELKISDPHESHEAQLLNYLKATGLRLGFVLYYGKEAIYRRKIV